MTPVILSAAQARERQRHATGEVAHCLCPLTQHTTSPAGAGTRRPDGWWRDEPSTPQPRRPRRSVVSGQPRGCPGSWIRTHARLWRGLPERPVWPRSAGPGVLKCHRLTGRKRPRTEVGMEAVR